MTTINTSKRAVIYARTSGDKQKDNTSIPRQIDECKKFITGNGWQFLKSYVDESKTGSKIEGRNSFKQMIKDAANEQFEYVIIYDISRFARDGCDIIQESKFLKNNFNVNVIDASGKFDTRKRGNTLVNFVFAGVAEEDRLGIMERTRKGCIANAQNGLQWSPIPPYGRSFKKTGKKSGYFYVNEDGEKLKKILKSYVDDDKSFLELAREHGITSAQQIRKWINNSQLAANPYIAVFNSPEIEFKDGTQIIDYKVEVPNFPAVVDRKLLDKVLAKMGHNKKTKRRAKRDYLLSGMVRCAHCGMYLKGQSQRGRSYYTHNNFYADRKPCPYMSIRLEILETHVMDYLTEFFFNKPAFDKAIKAAMPTNDDRDAIVQDIEANTKAQKKAHSKITNFTKAIGEGKKLDSLIDALESAEAEKQALEKRHTELEETLQTMPDPEIIKRQATFIRGKVMVEYFIKDWQDMSFKDLRRFLHFLFSDNPRQNHYGILLGKENDKWHIDFEGCFDFNHIISDGVTELKATSTEEQIAKIEHKLKSKDAFITSFKKYENTCNKTERLKFLIDEAKRLKNIIEQARNDANNAENELKGMKLFNDSDYL